MINALCHLCCSGENTVVCHATVAVAACDVAEQQGRQWRMKETICAKHSTATWTAFVMSGPLRVVCRCAPHVCQEKVFIWCESAALTVFLLLFDF